MSKPLLEKLIQEIAMFDMDAACKLHQRKDKYNDCNTLKGVMVFMGAPEGLGYWLDIHYKLEERRKNYHPHRDLMIEYANDKTIEFEFKRNDGTWRKCEGVPSFFEFYEYRKKPKVTKKVIEYRIYLDKENKIKTNYGKDPLPLNFEKWLSDWQKIEIEVEQND